jgi:hypothetical protein
MRRVDVQRPDDEPDNGDERKALLRDFSTLLTSLHAQHALAKFHPNHNDLHRSEKVSDILD